MTRYGVALLLLAVLGGPASAQPITTWGATQDGLRLGVAAEAGTAGERVLRIGIENTGASDVIVNLGVMFANGRWMTPSAIQLNATDAAGNPVSVRFRDNGPAAIAGRMDDYLVALASGASHVLREVIILDHVGQCRLRATFNGRGVSDLNGDMPGIALMNFWIGRLRSNEIALEVAGQPVRR